MEWVETTGRTIEIAKDAALDQLGVDEQDAEFEVLEEPKPGLFGRLRGEARVRARVRPTRPRPKEDRRDRRGRRGDGERGQERTSDRADGQAPSRPAARSTRSASSDREGESNVEQDVPIAQQAEVAETFLVGLLGELEISGTVRVREIDEETVEVGVTGEDLSHLIGPKGVTLQALQDVTRTVVQRRTGARNGRLLVDVSGYRQKRREALSRFTQELVATVQATGEQRVLEPMNPADRKVVHDTVNTLPGVRTMSEGEEPRRRVVILPEDPGVPA